MNDISGKLSVICSICAPEQVVHVFGEVCFRQSFASEFGLPLKQSALKQCLYVSVDHVDYDRELKSVVIRSAQLSPVNRVCEVEGAENWNSQRGKYRDRVHIFFELNSSRVPSPSLLQPNLSAWRTPNPRLLEVSQTQQLGRNLMFLPSQLRQKLRQSRTPSSR
jgi:hypothetical protein